MSEREQVEQIQAIAEKLGWSVHDYPLEIEIAKLTHWHIFLNKRYPSERDVDYIVKQAQAALTPQQQLQYATVLVKAFACSGVPLEEQPFALLNASAAHRLAALVKVLI